ncbi:MAG: HDOD domain-containing protein [Rhodocyclaceae bacterium]|nr:HDOD domain-containing protein [Rhodocyclaceae bacterium]
MSLGFSQTLEIQTVSRLETSPPVFKKLETAPISMHVPTVKEAMEFIAKPLDNLSAWTREYSSQPIPVLGRTVTAISALALDQEHVAARDIAAEVRRDPLMTLKTLIWAGKAMRRRNHASLSGEIETVEAAVVMMGITSFFRDFADLESFEARLHDYPEAQVQLLRVIGRAVNASNYATDWAAYRHDLDAAVIQEAALLHDLAEMLTWCFAPSLSISMWKLRTAHPSMRSLDIQRAVLGIALDDLNLELLKEWCLPSLLLRLADHHHANHAAVKNVLLAANLARHAANGWTDPALHDDFENIAKLLNQTAAWVEHRVRGDEDTNRISQT